MNEQLECIKNELNRRKMLNDYIIKENTLLTDYCVIVHDEYNNTINISFDYKLLPTLSAMIIMVIQELYYKNKIYDSINITQVYFADLKKGKFYIGKEAKQKYIEYLNKNNIK